MQIAFIGLGNMGAPMAANLSSADYKVLGYDVSALKVDGVVMAPSLEAAVHGANAIITMLPNGAILQDVVDQALDHAGPNALFLDCSTVDVASARAAAARITGRSTDGDNHHSCVDAPVSGGTAGAQAGTLTFMAGGDLDAFERAKPLLAVMGANIFHCGASGAGQAAKICNNMILGASMIATCEAFALADGLGLERQALFDVVAASSGQSWSMTSYCPAPGVGPSTPADNDYKPGFAADLMLKDLTLAQQAAQAANVTTPIGAQAQALYDAFVTAGGAGRDFSAMLDHLKASTP